MTENEGITTLSPFIHQSICHELSSDYFYVIIIFLVKVRQRAIYCLLVYLLMNKKEWDLKKMDSFILLEKIAYFF